MADVQNSTQTLQGKNVMPSLTVDNLQQSLDFFGGLGFEVEDRWEENGVLLGAMLKAGDARLGLSQDDGKKGRDRTKGVGMRIYIEAAGDIDQVAARAKAAGITLTNEPHDTEWGSRAFEVTEPSGFALTIASPAAT
ncbi:MAG: VOC family protein [Acidobacteria bacterium]|nr:VOC family protein [Acidobacteriota bacterium]